MTFRDLLRGWGARRVKRVLRARRLRTAFAIAWDRLRARRIARAGAVVLACLALVALLADGLASDLPLFGRYHGTFYFAPNVTRPVALRGLENETLRASELPGDWLVLPLVAYGPDEVPAAAALLAHPSFVSGHPLGTDAEGRDLFARLVHGTRTSLFVGFAASLAFVAVGTLLGALAGFFGGFFDAVVTRVVETLSAFPTLVLVLVVQALVARPTLGTLLFAIALTRWPEVARLVRAEVLLVGSQDYVLAARALGASPLRVLRRHVAANAAAPVIVSATFGVASVILIEASLDFLRVGVPAGSAAASWGEVLSETRDHFGAWWLLVFPGLLVLVTVLSLNLVAEALRDALDPRLRGAEPLAAAASSMSASTAPPRTSSPAPRLSAPPSRRR